MKYKLKIETSKTPTPDGVVAVKKTRVHNRLLNKLFGSTGKTVLVLGDSVKAISLLEINEGGQADGRSR